MGSGEYLSGSLMPSEHQLSDEFGIARPTVVRALRPIARSSSGAAVDERVRHQVHELEGLRSGQGAGCGWSGALAGRPGDSGTGRSRVGTARRWPMDGAAG